MLTVKEGNSTEFMSYSYQYSCLHATSPYQITHYVSQRQDLGKEVGNVNGHITSFGWHKFLHINIIQR